MFLVSFLLEGPFEAFPLYLSNVVLTVACFHSAGAVSDVEMQEHYDEFFEVCALLCLYNRIETTVTKCYLPVVMLLKGQP